MSKTSKDGWVRHRGGKCPVEAGTVIEYRLRKRGVGISAYPEQLNWGHDNHIGDIMAYRIHKPAEQPADDCELDLSQLSTPLVINLLDPHQENPLIWRDRIREIDRTVEALEEERVSLIQRLEGEGLQLLKGKVCGPVQPAEDMSDWRNWKVGDLIECVNDDGWMSFIAGGKYALISIGGGELELVGSAGNHVDIIEFMPDFKWHSRPSA